MKTSGACFLSDEKAKQGEGKEKRGERRRKKKAGEHTSGNLKRTATCPRAVATSLLLPAAKITECPDKTQRHNGDNLKGEDARRAGDS